MRPSRLAIAVALLLALGGCDASFDAFEETDDLTYSIFGYLDANARRHAVRVEPVLDSSFVGTGGSIDARVTTENLDTGETVVWADSTVRLGASDQVLVHNFVTDAPLEPEARYRFRVERERDGATSTAVVTLPPAFPVPSILTPPDLREGTAPGEATATTLVVAGIDRLGGVRAVYDYESCVSVPGEVVCTRRQTTAFHLADTTRRSNGVLEIDIPWQEDIPENPSASLGEFYSFRVTVAAASEDWPAYAADNLPGGGPEGEPLPPPRAGTNVEGGTGFLGGVFARTVEVPVRRD